MRKIVTKHRRRTIEFDEDREMWCCPDLRLESVRLMALKTRINQIDSTPKSDKCAVIVLSGKGDLIECTGFLAMVEGGEAWVRYMPEGFPWKVSADKVIKDTPEHRETLRKAVNHRREADELLARIPRVPPTSFPVEQETTAP